MKLSTLAALALVALLVSAGAAAAMPGVASTQNQNQADGHAQATDHADDAGGDENAAAGAANAPDDRGPHVDLPERVPDHVPQLHDLIRRFLSGDLDGSLGGAVSDETPGNSTETPADASG